MKKNIQSMSDQKCGFIPVVKSLRRDWRIPRIDANLRHLKEIHDEAQRKKLFKGTTPEGRELMRKILFRINRLLETPGQTPLQVSEAAEADIVQYGVLRNEFSLLASKLFGAKEDDWHRISSHEFAVILVIRMYAELILKAALLAKRVTPLSH